MRPVKFPTDFTCWFPQSLLWHHLPVLPERQELIQQGRLVLELMSVRCYRLKPWAAELARQHSERR
jgi:hypothetical protein